LVRLKVNRLRREGEGNSEKKKKETRWRTLASPDFSPRVGGGKMGPKHDLQLISVGFLQDGKKTIFGGEEGKLH